MKPGIPWSVKGIEPEVREAAKHAARKAGMTLGEWLNTVILDQSDEETPGNQAEPMTRHEEILEADAPHDLPPRRDEATIRLEDIASQLSQLAQRERESATIMPYEVPRPKREDSETIHRILNRIDSNERQAVEAFTAMNERLSVLGRQIAGIGKPQTFEKPEDVPGFSSLEGAIRNVVEHIEVSEKRTRDGLKSMQDRMAEMSQRASQTNAEDILRSAPAFTSLEARIADMASRMQRSESQYQALPELVRQEVNQLADRIEQVRKTSEAGAAKAQSEAVTATQRELREIEGRILGLLKDAQSALGSQSSTSADLQRLRGDMAALNKRIDEVGLTTARERDVHALRVAVEQLSARMAQGPDMRPIADLDRRVGELSQRLEQNAAAPRHLPQIGELERRIGELSHRIEQNSAATRNLPQFGELDRRIGELSQRIDQNSAATRNLPQFGDLDRRMGELSQRLDQNSAATRNLPQFGELERRLAELDHRLAEAVRLQGDNTAVTALEQHLGAFSDRLAQTEEQLSNLGTIETAIHQLYQGLEDNRTFATKVAEEAATRAAERVMSAVQSHSAEPSHELQALRDGLQAVRDSAAHADQRNQETLEAVHETLEQIVNKLAELETSAAGHQIAANMAQQAAPAAQLAAEPQWSEPADLPPQAAPQPLSADQFFDPSGVFPQPVFDVQPAPQPVAFQPQLAPAPPMPQAPAMPDLAPPAVDPQLQQAQDYSQAQLEAYAQAQQAGYPPGQTAGLPPGMEPALEGGDDFIAAARRAAQAAASRGSVLSPENKPALKPGANSRFRLSLPFLRPKNPPPITYVGGKPVTEASAAPATAGSMRRKLILAGIVLLAAVSAVGFNFMARGAKPVKQSMTIEMPVEDTIAGLTGKAEPAAGLDEEPSGTMDSVTAASNVAAADPLVTGSLPAQKTDASLSALVAEPGTAMEAAELPDPEVGTEPLRQAAARGDAKAQFIVGSRYLDGQLVAQDLPKAAKWYQQAASRGLAPAQYRLATLFERGKGVPQDIAAALLWYERAAEGGNVKAMHNAAVIAAGNQAGTPNYDKAFRWFKAAAERGLKDSQFNLAVLYERGLGAKVDKPAALLWYDLAGKQGDADAAKRATELAATMPGADVAAVNVKVNGWQPLPALDDANVVAITAAAWNDQASPAEASEDIATPEPASPVKQAQMLLTRLGYNVGEPDGNMGTKTQNAIRLFQLQTGLKVTGEVTPELLDAMREKAG